MAAASAAPRASFRVPPLTLTTLPGSAASASPNRRLAVFRLVRLLGHSHALDLILTGRAVSGEEALQMGLANRLVPTGRALEEALALAREIASRPQAALRSDRLSSYEQWELGLEQALALEYRHGMATLETGEMVGGLERYASGDWRGGEP